MPLSGHFPSQSIVSWYIEAENMLNRVLEIVPYCNEHNNVWSPKLVSILQETCSQLDSLWKYEIGGTNEQTIADYCRVFCERMKLKWLIFWGEQAEKIQPFVGWDPTRPSQSLPWWQVYQEVKHNRIENYNKATLENTIKALAGLFLAILRFEGCRDAVGHAFEIGVDRTRGYCNPLDCLSDIYDCSNPVIHLSHVVFSFRQIVVESKLFSYPVGWWGKQKDASDVWDGEASYRFQVWFANQSWRATI